MITVKWHGKFSKVGYKLKVRKLTLCEESLEEIGKQIREYVEAFEGVGWVLEENGIDKIKVDDDK